MDSFLSRPFRGITPPSGRVSGFLFGFGFERRIGGSISHGSRSSLLVSLSHFFFDLKGFPFLSDLSNLSRGEVLIFGALASCFSQAPGSISLFDPIAFRNPSTLDFSISIKVSVSCILMAPMSSRERLPALQIIGSILRGLASASRPPLIENQTVGPNSPRGLGAPVAPDGASSSGAD